MAKKKAAAKKAAPKKAAKKAAPKKAAKKAAPKKAAKKAAPKKAAKKAAPKKAAKKAAPKKAAKKAAPKKPVKKGAPEKTVSRRAVVMETKEAVKAPPKSIREKSKGHRPKAPTNIKTIKNTEGKILSHRATHELASDNAKKKTLGKAKKRKSILGGSKSGVTFKRYSDKDLKSFRKLIDEKIIKAKTELQYLQGLISREDSSGTDDTENRYASMEDGSMANQREQLSQMAGRQMKFIGHLEKALIRIENKTYGICRETGNLIDKKRLKAVPHATLSKAAKDAKRQ